MEYIIKRKNFILMAALVIFISYMPFMNDFLLWGHDIGFHLGRIEGLAISLSNGDFLGRINPVNGYGYASGIMYPQLFLYIPAVLRLMGISLMNAYKFFVLLINTVTFIIAYFSFKNILQLDQKIIAMLAAAFYALGLYRLSTLYLRAALGESLGMTFLPLLFWGMYELFAGKERKWWIAVIGWTCVLQSHFLTAEISLVFCVFFFLTGIKRIFKEGRVILIIKAVLLTVLLNAFFIIPFIHYFVICDFQVFHMDTGILAQTAVYFSQMFSTFVDNSGSLVLLGATAGEMPVSIGIISLITLLVYGILRVNTANKLYRSGDRFFLLIILILLAASNLCPWGVLNHFPRINKFVSSIQFLFRLFSPAYLFITVIFAIDLCVLKDYVKESVMILVAALLIMGNCWYYLDSTVQTQKVLSEEEAEDTASVDGTYLYNDFPYLENLYDRGEKIEIIPNDKGLSVGEYVKQGTDMSFEISNCDNNVIDIEVPIYYYPTYRAQLNHEELAIEQGTDGVLRIKNVSQDGTVRIWFPEHSIWLAADLVSLCTAAVCIMIIAKNVIAARHRSRHIMK